MKARYLLFFCMLLAIIGKGQNAESLLYGTDETMIDPNKALSEYDSTFDGKCNYKALTEYSYEHYDSLHPDIDIFSIQRDEYNKSGKLVKSIQKNTWGKVTDSAVYSYNSANKLISYLRFDSLKRLTYDQGFTYTTMGKLATLRVTENQYSSINVCPGVTKDTLLVFKWTTTITYNDKNLATAISIIKKGQVAYFTFIGDADSTSYRYWYDTANNLAKIYCTRNGHETKYNVYGYDRAHQITMEGDYVDSTLIAEDAFMYKGDGGYTRTNKRYGSVGNGACTPDINITVERYDNKGRMLTSVETAVKSDDTTVTRMSYTRAFNNGNITRMEEVTEETGYLYYSKYTEIETSEYDSAGHITCEMNKGGGQYATNYSHTWKYNKHGKVIQELDYGSCVDKPMSTTTDEYYKNDTLKMMKVVSEYSTEIITYDTRGNITAAMNIESGQVRNAVVYKYQYWKK